MDKKRTRDDDHSVPIDRLIQKHREALQQRDGLLPGMPRAARPHARRQRRCTTRATRRLRSDLATSIAKLEARIHHLESGAHLDEFDRNVVPYVEAYHRQSGVPKRKLTHVVVPGESRMRFETEDNTQSQAHVVEEFLTKVTGEVPRARIERSDVCPRCVDQPMVLVPQKALIVCPACGHSSTFLDATSQSISYDDSLEMVTFQYKRGSHFADWLSNCQGAETFEVSQDILDLVMHELYKQRVVDLNEITTKRVREILKAHKLRRCYEHCPQIVSRVTGRPPLKLPAEVVELCKLMFTALQVPFQKHCPPQRKNMLSYSFVLSKMLYILGYDDLVDTLSMLKGREKLLKMDVVWQKIAASLDWPYYPSA